MKKVFAILFMLVFILAVVCVASMATLPWDSGQESEQSASKLDNPIPPDVAALGEIGLEPFVSELPVLMIDTDGRQIFKETPIWAKVAVMDDVSGKNDILDKVDDVLTATVKYRGASSYSRFDKPQYRVKFYKEKDGKKLEYDLLGLGADSEWVFNGPYLDRTLLRNYLMYNLSAEVMDWAPGCTYFELFVNGKYQGVYLAVEPITSGVQRLNLSQHSLVSGATAYIVKRDRSGTESSVLHTYGELNGRTANQLSVGYPGESDLTETQRTWIETDISAFEEALYAPYFTDPEIGYAHYIDVDSFVDYFILNEFALNHDSGNLSTYAYKEINDKLKLCVWDFNNGFDNYQWFSMEPDAFHTTGSTWFDRLLQDRAFVDKVVKRYRELRKGSLSNEHVQEIIDDGLNMLGESIERNFAVWGYTFNYALLDEVGRDPKSFDEALSQLEGIIKSRLEFMDGNMKLLYQNCIN